MRIRELHQRRFGLFTDNTLELIPDHDDSTVPGLHVIYGRNEAGKTTTLHAIRYGIYGIPDLRNDPRTYDFLHRKPDLRIAMVVDSAAGERIAFTRRKKAGDTCFDITDTAPAPDLQRKLERLLQGIDRNLFTHKYGIDHGTLLRGGAGLAGDNNDLGESLFAAATGIVGVRATLNSLATQIDELLKATGRSGRIPDAVKRFNEARVAAEKARRAGRSWAPKQKEIAEAKASLAALNGALAQATADHQRATDVNDAIEYVVQRALLLQQIQELGVVIETWSTDFEEHRKGLRSTIATAEAALLVATGELDIQLKRQAAHVAAVDKAVLGATDRTRDLGERITEYLKAKGERSKLAADLKRAEQAVATACLAIRTGADPDQARELIPPLPAREAASALLDRHADIDREVRAAADTLRECESELLTFDVELPAASAAPDGLDVVRTAMKRIETVDTALLAQLEAGLELKSKQLSDAAGALPRCVYSADALLALAAPLEQTVSAFDEKLRAAQSKVEQFEASLAGSIQSLEAMDADIAAKSEGRDVPTIDELEELRSRRDNLWRRIRAAWTGVPTDDKTDSIAAGAEEETAAAFEESVGTVDRHADRMVLAGEIVGAIAALQESRDGLAEEIARQEAALTAAGVEQEKVETEWRALWAAIDVEAGTVTEMRAWLEGLRNVREIASSTESDSVAAGALRARVERARNDLSSALTAVGKPPASEEISVEILQATAAEMLEAADRARDEAVKRDADRRNLEVNRERARVRDDAARVALGAWRDQWDEVAPSVGLSVGALPEAGTAMLVAIGALEEALEGLTLTRDAHDVNNRVVTTFESDVEGLVASIGGNVARDLADKPADQVIRELAEVVRVCAKAADDLAAIGPQIEKLEGEKRARQDAITSANEELKRLTTVAGLANVEDLDTTAAVWTQREGLRTELRAVDQKIVEITKMPPDEVVSYLGDSPPEHLPGLIVQCETALADMTGERDEMSDTVDRLQRELGELQGTAQVEPHLADMDDARAEIERLAAQYAPLKLQHDLLTNYLREKASERMGPSMKRAGAIFSELTCGAYLGVTQDVDEADRQVLQVVPSGKPNMDRAGLSTGTGDQLYLALRLASIYQHLDVAGNEPIPFIVDDILTAFDDERSAATMRALGELATRTQVLFFTHHQHLVDLARAEVPTETLRVLELG